MTTYRLTTNGGIPLGPAASFADTQLDILRHLPRWPVYLRQTSPADMSAYVVTFRYGAATICHHHGVEVTDHTAWPDFAKKFDAAITRANPITKEPQLT